MRRILKAELAYHRIFLMILVGMTLLAIATAEYSLIALKGGVWIQFLRNVMMSLLIVAVLFFIKSRVGENRDRLYAHLPIPIRKLGIARLLPGLFLIACFAVCFGIAYIRYADPGGGDAAVLFKMGIALGVVLSMNAWVTMFLLRKGLILRVLYLVVVITHFFIPRFVASQVDLTLVSSLVLAVSLGLAMTVVSVVHYERARRLFA